MPFFGVLSIIDSSFCAMMATLFLWKGRRQTLAFALLFYALAIWTSIPWLILKFPPTYELIIVRALYTVSCVVPILCLAIALQTMDVPLSHWTFKVALVLGGLFAILNRLPHFVLGMHYSADGYSPIPGPLFWLFILYFSILSTSMIAAILVAYRRTRDSSKRNRLRWIGISFMVANLSGAVHFSSAYSGVEWIPHDLVVMAFVTLVSYATLKRRLNDIELLSRNVAIQIGTWGFIVFPILLGRLLAAGMLNLSMASRGWLVVTLMAAAFFLSWGTGLLRLYRLPAALRLNRVFLIWSVVYLLSLFRIFPMGSGTWLTARLTLTSFGALLMAWISYRMDSLRTADEPKLRNLYAGWRWGSLGILAITAFTPWIIPAMRGNHADAVINLSPGLGFFMTWWLTSLAVMGFWVMRRFPQPAGPASSRHNALKIVSFLGSLSAGLLFVLYMMGKVSTPWFVPLGTLAGFLIGWTFLDQLSLGQKMDHRNWIKLWGSLILSTSCGYMLSLGLWFQMASVILLLLCSSSLLQTVRPLIETWVDRYLLQEKYSYLAEIRRIADDIYRFTNIPDLLKHLVNDLSSRAGLTWVGVWLFDLAEGRFVLRQASDPKPSEPVKRDPYAKFPFTMKDPIIHYLQSAQSLMMTHEFAVGEHFVPSASAEETLGHSAAAQLEPLHIASAYPVRVDRRMIGFLGFGDKETGAMFNEADYGSLTELGQKAERAIGQAYMLYEQSLMLSKLAHDTLNALHAMGMVLSILDNGLIGPVNEIQKKQIGIALNQRQLIEECLTDLRELERLVMMRMQGTWRMDPYDLAEVARDSVKAYQARAAEKKVGLDAHAQDVAQALGDARAVRRVIDNLIVNALKFTPEGGRITVSVMSKGTYLSVTVADTGPGIPPDELPRVFDPFYSGPTGLAIAHGTGLGLSVVKEVAALHKGAVHVESTVGVGTTFIVDLPSVARAKEFEKKEGSEHASNT